MSDINICSIFGDLNTQKVKETKNIVQKQLEKFIKKRLSKIYLGHFGLFHLVAMNTCCELKNKYNFDIIHVCSTKKVLKTMKCTIRELFGNIQSVTFAKKIKKQDPILQNIEKVIDLCDTVFLFYEDEESCSIETRHALNCAKTKNKQIFNLYQNTLEKFE